MAHELNPFGGNNKDGASLKMGDKSSSPLSLGLPLLRKDEFWAVNDVSFELRHGECIGLIGRNGAGKTTLLKMLNGLIKPDHGRIEMRGRVGALIALGAGFNPILTGRENIYVNAAVLGLAKKEIDARLEEIIEYAELGKFIDSPVQSYSLGMQVRLGFAVATALQPDILLLDEVLAVGDISFRVRCYNRIRDILPGTAVIFVSHSMWDVSKICSSVLVLNNGSSVCHTSVREGILAYNDLNAPKNLPGEHLVADKDSNIRSFRLISLHAESAENESRVHMSLEVVALRECGEVRLRVVFVDLFGTAVAEWDSADHEGQFLLANGSNNYDFFINKIRLIAGNYKLMFVLTDMKDQGYHLRIEDGLHVSLSPRIVAGMPYRI